MNLIRRILALLQPQERRKVWAMVASVLFSALLDFAGLAVLLPVLYFLLEGGEQLQVALLFSALAFVVIVLKCLLTTYFLRYRNKVLMSFYKRLSFSMYSSYYDRGLLFIREQGSNKLGYDINSMSYSFSQNLLSPLFRVAGDVLLILMVTVALLVWNAKLVLLLYASFVPFVALYFFLVKKRVQQCGQEDMAVKREQSRVVMDTFRGYVELEVNGAFPSLQSLFLEGIDKISANREKMDLLMRLPQFLTELAVVVGLGVLVAFGDGDVRMLVGVFAVAAFRLLPAVRSILSGWTQVQNARCSLDVLEEGLLVEKSVREDENQLVDFEECIDIQGLTYAYPDGQTVLKDFTCSVRRGEYVGFCGTSGVGKSTLFNLLLGFLQPSKGAIRIDGKPLSVSLRSSWLQHIGYVPQEVFVFRGTLAENIALGCESVDELQLREVLRHVRLDAWVSTLPQGIHTPLAEAGAKLSGGQKQRIGIARALYRGVSVLLLDEATSALDNETEYEINQTLLQLKESYQGLTILSIAHRDSSLGYCDRIVRITKEG